MAAARIAPICSKCVAIKKSDKLSCCAPGGAWFNNCDNRANSNTGHTWVEGMQACKDVVISFSDKAKSQFILINQTTTTQLLNDVEHQTIESTLVSVNYDTPVRNNEDNDQLSHIVSFTSVLCILVFEYSDIQIGLD